MSGVRKKRPAVVVTGLGVITSLGMGLQDNWRKLTAGQSGIRRIQRFSIEGLPTTIAGTIDFIPVEPACAPERSQRFAEAAIEEAITASGIGTIGNFPGPLFLGAPPCEMEWPQRMQLSEHVGRASSYDDLLRAAASGGFRLIDDRFRHGSVAANLKERFGTRGSPVTVTTACASGASAITLGLEAIRNGETDAALCVGTDGSVHAEALARFSLLSALSTRNDPPGAAARPFSRDRDGFVIAEGAGALVLESLDCARARGARILGVIAGCGERADSFHRTRSSPDAKPIVASIRNAIDDAGLQPADINYVNAHGTGTPENDKMEYLGLSTVMGEAARSIPVSSNKSMIGHTLSAAGAIEAVFTLLTLDHQRIPPTINYHTPDPEIPLDVVPNVARDARIDYALSNSFGFGGQNVSLVMAREPA